jgi:beta-lactamase regulating signal transducer with metallopeptidase domain
VTAELALRAAVILATGAALCGSMRSVSAAARHALWLGTVIATLALPLASLVGPAWAVVDRPGPLLSVLAHAGVDAAAGHRERELVTPDAGAVRMLVDRAASAWLMGSGLVALYFLSGHVRLGRLRRRARPAPASWQAGCDRLAARARLAQPVEVLVSSALSSPLVTGLQEPVVLIPPAGCAWSDARREAVLVHELAHIRRRDLAAQLVGQALVALHWFNPLAWHALRQMRRERELACDEEVLNAGVEAIAYATELLAIAIANGAQPVPAAALSMARTSELEGRLSALLARPAGKRRRGTPVVASVLVACVAVTVAGAHVTRPAPLATGSPAVRWMILPASSTDAFTPVEADGLSSADSRTREWATLQLGLASGGEAVPGLLQALTDPEARVREKAAVGLAWRRDDRIGPALVAAAADPSPRVREKVLVALAFSSEPRAAAVLDAARTDPDASVRDKANKLRILR